MARWLQPELFGSSRWTMDQLDELKAELNRRARLDPLWLTCADAIGSLQFDLVDAKRETDATRTRAGFAVGDVVRATAGRPPMTSMTVIKVDDYSDRYLLEWFTPDGELHRGTAHSDDIELATPDVPEATAATLTRVGFR